MGTPSPAPGAPPRPGQGGPLGKLDKKKKIGLGLAAVGGVVGIAYVRSKSGGGSASDASDTSGGSDTATQPANFTGDDSEGDFDDLDSQVSSLQEQLATITAHDNQPGKPPNLWDIAKQALVGRGNKNPTNSEIWHERKKLFNVGQSTKPAPKPTAPKKRKPKPVRKK
jgi:hypothetical protein